MKIIFNTFLLILLSYSFTIAQESSPYTRYGIGDINYGYSARHLGIGDIASSVLDPDHILISNPASWSALNRTRIEFSLGYKGVDISDKNRSAFTSETEFRGATFGFPISRDYGIGFVTGILPYSKISYVAEKKFEDLTNDFPTYKLTYEGRGGLSKFFLGSSVILPLGIHFGASFDYYFGNLRYYSKIEFEKGSSNINTTFENNRNSDGVGTTIGLISPDLSNVFQISSLSNLRLGFSLNFINDLNTDTLFSATSLSVIDTLSIASIKTSIPYRLIGGISFAFQEMHNFNLDFMYQPWSDYRFNNIKSDFLRDASKISFAYEYIPKKNIGMTSWELMTFRAGLSYEQTQYLFNGKGIDQYSVFGGFSFPIGIDNTIDFALQYGFRGTTENDLLKENFVKIYLGISFGELWFLRFEK